MMSILETVSKVLKHKTLKREIAGLALVGLVILTYHMFYVLDPEFVPVYENLYNTIFGTVSVWVIAAFGGDAVLKHLGKSK
jgi:hypothetical protein